MVKERKRSGESKYQVQKEGYNHKLDRLFEKLDEKARVFKENLERQKLEKHGEQATN